MSSSDEPKEIPRPLSAQLRAQSCRQETQEGAQNVVSWEQQVRGCEPRGEQRL